MPIHALKLTVLLAILAGCAAAAHGPTGWVDRIEGQTAVVLVERVDGEYEQRDVPLASLPPGVREGDRLVNGHLDTDGRRRQAARIRELQRALFGVPADESARGPPR